MDCLRLWDLVKRRAESQLSLSGELVECHQASQLRQGTFKAVRLAQCFWRPYKNRKVTSSMPAAANTSIYTCVSCPSVLQCVSFLRSYFWVCFQEATSAASLVHTNHIISFVWDRMSCLVELKQCLHPNGFQYIVCFDIIVPPTPYHSLSFLKKTYSCVKQYESQNVLLLV